MPAPLTVRCPACEASLKLKSREAIGRRVACPRCRRPFVVEDPADADDFSALDEFDSFEDTSLDDESNRDEGSDDYGPPAGRRAPRARATGSSRGTESHRSRSGRGRSRSRGGAKSRGRDQKKLMLLIGGGAASLALLVGLVFLAGSLLGGRGGASGDVDTAWLPPDSEFVLAVNVANVWNAKEVQNLTNMPQVQEALAELKTRLGMGPEESLGDIERVVAGGAGLDAAAGGGLAEAMQNSPSVVAVIRRRSPWNMPLVKNQSREATHAGKTYYVSNGEDVASYFPDEQTRLIGPEASIQAALERGPGGSRLSQFAFVDAGYDLVFAVAPRNPSLFQQGQAPPPPMFVTDREAYQRGFEASRKLTAFSMGATLRGALDVKAQFRFSDSSAASTVDSAISDGLRELKRMLAQQKRDAPQAAMLFGPAEEILDSIRSQRSGDVVTVSARVPESTISGQAGILTMLLPAVQESRGTARRTAARNSLRVIGMALHSYHDAHNAFPPAASTASDGRPLLSWRVLLLPHLSEQTLYEQFRLDEPWDSPHNRALIPRMPQVFTHPGGGLPPGHTAYLGVAGPGTVFEGTTPRSIRDITDGTSLTMAVVEVDDAHSVEWTRPQDFDTGSANPPAGLRAQPGGQYQVLFWDGSVKMLTNLTRELFLALSTRAGGEQTPLF